MPSGSRPFIGSSRDADILSDSHARALASQEFLLFDIEDLRMMDVRRKIPIAILDYLCALCCLQSGGQHKAHR